jgi:hypothetical protein
MVGDNASPRPAWCRGKSCSFGLSSVVALLYAARGVQGEGAARSTWPEKEGTSFPDAISTARRWPWAECFFPRPGYHPRSSYPESSRVTLPWLGR